MDEELARFLASATRRSTESVTWGDGTMPLTVAFYSCNEQSPPRYVSSVRAIVFRDDTALVVTDPSGEMYILPGGRVEQGESPMETLKREVLEETGWTLLEAELLGFMHFHHLAPRPADYEYPYPDFIWPIYQAETDSFHAGAIVPDDDVAMCQFHPIDEIRQLRLRKGELLLFEDALRLRRHRSI